MMQILISVVVLWIVATVLIFALIRAAVRRSERLESNRDRLSKQWANQKKFSE